MSPARLGAAAGVALFVLAVLPYAAVDPASLGVYYGVGAVGPPVLVTFAGVAVIALLSGATGRSDPATTAGVAVTLAAFVALFGGAWALAAAGPAGGMEAGALLDYHRFAFVAAALGLFAAAAWHARRTLGG